MHFCTSFWSPTEPLSLSAYQRKIGACPLRLPVIVTSLEAIYSTFLANVLIYSKRVIKTPQGNGHPRNLWPEMVILPIGFLKVTFGA